MAKAYVLSESDVRAMKDLFRWYRGGGTGKSQRPPPLRRPPREGAKAELIGAFAIIKGGVPGSLMNDSIGNWLTDPLFTPGVLEKDATASTFTAGALLVNPSGSAALEGGALAVVNVINPSLTDFQAVAGGVLMPGTLADENGVKSFIISWPDLRGLPGYAKGTASGVDDTSLQIPFHSGGEETFKLDAADCAG